MQHFILKVSIKFTSNSRQFLAERDLCNLSWRVYLCRPKSSHGSNLGNLNSPSKFTSIYFISKC